MKYFVNIVINYANEDEVINYAKSLSEQMLAKHISLVIVINKEGEINLEKFIDILSNIVLDILVYSPNENLGYLNGLIYGYRNYIEHNNAPTWVVMSNTDIEFDNNQFFNHVMMNKYDNKIGCIAPSVYSPTKDSYENPQYKERLSLSKLRKRIFIFEHPRLAVIYIKLAEIKAKLLRKQKEGSQFVYSAHGCFFILENGFAEIISNKNYKALMYSEEAFIAELLIKHKRKCYYDSQIEVIHKESTVTGKLNVNTKSKYIADSLKEIRDEFFKTE